ncbi:rod shape-determining protein MreD [Lactobacillus colini]|uniref:Rod shape-determining protein MreD n=1 Tax=Lactobacillus colini TaxID=1819254 RepID=A0ABS4MDQ1_9LACO|nr:rod shape-determining protein MreD [Lactobacillus colini]MBP2057815.1 rod shape-determining protein MreD [Lactobacillus colini]
MRILREWYVAIALLVALVLDGVIAFYAQGIIFKGTYGASCWFTIIGIVLMGLCDDRNDSNIWLVFGIGIVADLYYLGFLGVYTVAFPAVYFLAKSVARFLPEIFWARLMVSLAAYLLLDAYLFLAYSIAGTISLPISSLLMSILPSWGMCLIIFLITYSFWIWLINKYPFLKPENRFY